MFKVAGMALILGVVAVGSIYTRTSGAEMLRLTGHGVSPSLNMDINIAAIKTKNGKVEGQSVIPQNFKGKVVELSPVELMPPSGERNSWCVNLSVKGSDEFNNWLWFVKDVNGGADELSYAVGTDITCASAGIPVQPFEPISSGDFKGDIR